MAFLYRINIRNETLELECLLALVLAACALSLQQRVDAVPIYDFILKAPDSASVMPEDNACYKDEGGVEELCQRCAKLTKSNVVYPMCCEDHDAAREWCFSYVNFHGRQ
ncbi:Reticulon-2 [Frankliniella fusca]|uniref:Reticulon-2 n=1 Tax=Frankliniella fusca TaxID=407009 RepID=A0AAE1HQ53_9NEOP|nr:Reticulon-2 [Frankliniella fusca]